MNVNSPIRIATRKSPLALWQAHHVASRLQGMGFQTELVPVVTSGDLLQKTKLSDVQLSSGGADLPPELKHLNTGKGLFIKEIQEALLARQADLAVHSLKDLPVEETPSLEVFCHLEKKGGRDVLILSPELQKHLELQHPKALAEHLEQKISTPVLLSMIGNLIKISPKLSSLSVGTTSARRQFYVQKFMGSHTPVEVLRGNVDSRLKKVQEHQFSAILLSEAGLERLNLWDSASMVALQPQHFVPAPAQGIVALECRQGDTDLMGKLLALTHPATTWGAHLERLTMALLGGSCHTAIAAWWNPETGLLHVFQRRENAPSHEACTPIPPHHIAELQSLSLGVQHNAALLWKALLKSPLSGALSDVLRGHGFQLHADL